MSGKLAQAVCSWQDGQCCVVPLLPRTSTLLCAALLGRLSSQVVSFLHLCEWRHRILARRTHSCIMVVTHCLPMSVGMCAGYKDNYIPFNRPPTAPTTPPFSPRQLICSEPAQAKLANKLTARIIRVLSGWLQGKCAPMPHVIVSVRYHLHWKIVVQAA
jgi:hypothetical protein